MTFQHLTLRRQDAVTTVVINRPTVLNALNVATLEELDACFAGLADDASTRVIVITGAGNRAFVAGADIAEMSKMTGTEAQRFAEAGQALCERIERAHQPVIAAINGFALGGGCELAMACTIRMAADTARVGLPEVTLGLLPGFGGTQRLPRLVGPGRALELLLTGDAIDAQEAWRIGLVNRVVASDDLESEAAALAATLASRPPLAMAAITSAVRSGMQMGLDQGCAFEAVLFGNVWDTDDMREGTRAFLEKRPASFTGQ